MILICPKCKRMYDEERTWAVNVEPFVFEQRKNDSRQAGAGYYSLTSASVIGAFRSGAAKFGSLQQLMSPCFEEFTFLIHPVNTITECTAFRCN
jgi:hypothetical protein